MFGNIRSDVVVINTFISTNDGSMGGSIGQSMQISSRSIFYTTIFLFILSIPVCVFPFNGSKYTVSFAIYGSPLNAAVRIDVPDELNVPSYAVI